MQRTHRSWAVFVLCSLAFVFFFGAAVGKTKPTPAQNVSGVAKPLLPCTTPLGLPGTDEKGFTVRLYAWLEQDCYNKQQPAWTEDRELRDTGPYILGNNYGTHPAVRIWYSPEVWTWMNTPPAKRGEIPDGAVIVKEMHDTPASANNGISGWTTMVRDRQASWDGWFWSYHGLPSDSSSAISDLTVPPGNGPVGLTSYPDSGFGNYCVNCHGSTDNLDSTFADKRNVTGIPMTYLVVNPSMKAPSALVNESEHQNVDIHARHSEAKTAATSLKTSEEKFDPLFVKLFGTYNYPTPPPLPGETWDHVVSGPRPKGPAQYITSDQCLGCHDATQNMAAPPNMIYPADGSGNTTTNLSPYGEWRASLMGLAGRDPVFYAQLASERTIHNQKDLPSTIQNLCFRCHGAMGQRQLALDKGPKASFIEDLIFKYDRDKDAKYGALGREGVSCAICHHISADGLGTSSTYTGQFNVGKPNEMYGPFDNPITVPMDHGVGITPVVGAQMKSSALCGSCHTINLPIYDDKGNEIGTEFEQTTYFEWQNSIFQNEKAPVDPKAQTCQDCHMPQSFQLPGYAKQALSYRIASIEDNTFPFVDNRAPDKDITLQVRDQYARHTLVGMNVFVVRMFEQFSKDLGIRQTDPMATYSNPAILPNGGAITPGLQLAESSAVDLAQNRTATLEVSSMKRTATSIEVAVKVNNLAGHCLPSGVSFRRAFLDFELKDKDGLTVWASGATDRWGVITNGVGGPPLPTEFFDRNPAGEQMYQPHHEVIGSESEVQIYEELVKSPPPQSVFTTSFVELYHVVKENRLRPRGWSPTVPHAQETPLDPITEKDPSYLDGSGSDTVKYIVPLNEKTSKAATVSVRLFYQSIPPYYLKQRFSDSTMPDTARLYDFVSQLNVKKNAVSNLNNWKLLITTTTQPLTQAAEK